MNSSFITFNKVAAHHKIPREDWELNGKYNYIYFPGTKSRIDLLDLADKPTDPLFESLGSLEYTGGFIEEAPEISFKAYSVLKSRTNRHNNKLYGIGGKLLLTANPTKNWVKQEFYLPWKSKTLDPGRMFIQALYSDNPYTADTYGETLSQIKIESIRQRLRDGNWDFEDQGTVFRGLNDIVGGGLKDPIPGHAYVMGVDVAKYQDFTVVFVIDLTTFEIVYFERWNKIDWDYTEKKVATISDKYFCAGIVFDASGVGDPIAEQLERDGKPIIKFKFTSASKKFLIENLALKIEQGQIRIPYIDVVFEELRSFTWEYTSGGNVRYSAPDGQHDDCVIALALAVYGAGHYHWDANTIKQPYPTGTLGHIEEQIDMENEEKELEYFV